MHRIFALLSSVLIFVFQLLASAPREGMWIPFLLNQGNIAEMQDMGLKISAEDIYSINHSSLKDAILKFGGGCTGSVISSEGLVLTNHHCGYGSIQRHSTVENDLLKNGFWAKTLEEELPNKSLSVTFIERMEDVTGKVIAEGWDEMTIAERNRYLQEKYKEITEKAVGDNPFKSAEVVPFYGGNQYVLIVKKIFRDVRLVGAPPSGIGKFGGDTDNWIWPRHTGDFSLFRIYANEQNEPAEYSEENVPYSPAAHLTVDDDGIKEGDFTMVFGFPASTRQYLTSDAVKYEIEKNLPTRIKLRTMRLEVMNRYMSQNDTVQLQYASKQSGVSNAWKKWKGMIKGLRITNALDKKEQFELTFKNEASREDRQEYRSLLPAFEATYPQFLPYDLARNYLIEAGLGLELVSFANRFRRLVALSETGEVEKADLENERQRMIKRTKNFFEDYYQPIDREIFPKLLQAYARDIDPQFLPDAFEHIRKKFNNDFEAYTSYVFKKSFLDDEEALIHFLEKYDRKDARKLKQDPAYRLMSSLINGYLDDIRPQWIKYNARLDSLYRIYIKAQLELFPDATHYPDANFTLRLTYGKVQGFEPRDAVRYDFQTYLDGIMEKNYTGEEEYKIPGKLQALYAEKDFGDYGVNGQLPVCFVATNHTSGGNSGSPVLNAEGELCGLNFDRNWEGTMSDIHYDPALCRNISVDIRYVLFIIDKYAGAQRLIDELTFN